MGNKWVIIPVTLLLLLLAAFVTAGEWVKGTEPVVICQVFFEDDTDNGVTTEINTQDVHTNLSGFNTTAGASARGTILQNCVFNDDIASELVPQVGGLYELHFTISFEKSSGGGSARQYELAVFVNDVEKDSLEFHTVLTKQNELESHGVGGFLRLNAGDRVNVRVENLDGTENIGVHNANLHLDRHSD